MSGATPPWQSCGWRDAEAALLFCAVFRQRRRLASQYPLVPVMDVHGTFADGAPLRAMPVGALVHLWGRWPDFRGRCPECGGSVVGVTFAGMLAEADVFGVCRRCALVVHRRYLWGIGPIVRSFLPLLKGTPFSFNGGWAQNPSYGGPHTALIAVLQELGERDLPDARTQGVYFPRPDRPNP